MIYLDLQYETRDGKGNDILKLVKIKEFPLVDVDFECPVCHTECKKGIPLKKIVSSSFTDYAFLDKYVCEDCSKLFSLYFYNYIVDPDGIRLLNVRQLRDELCKPQKPPFRFVITTSQKKHLFYRSIVNNNPERFYVNLETEPICTTPSRMAELFGFVENLVTIGASKKGMQSGEIPFAVLQKVSFRALEYLNYELKTSREIQIPLYCGQKLEKSEEDCLWNLDLILKRWSEGKQL